MTKDTPYVPSDRPVEEKMKALPETPAPPKFKAIRDRRLNLISSISSASVHKKWIRQGIEDLDCPAEI